MEFFDRNGNATCYTHDGKHIYLWNGVPVAHITTVRSTPTMAGCSDGLTADGCTTGGTDPRSFVRTQKADPSALSGKLNLRKACVRCGQSSQSVKFRIRGLLDRKTGRSMSVIFTFGNNAVRKLSEKAS